MGNKTASNGTSDVLVLNDNYNGTVDNEAEVDAKFEHDGVNIAVGDVKEGHNDATVVDVKDTVHIECVCDAEHVPENAGVNAHVNNYYTETFGDIAHEECIGDTECVEGDGDTDDTKGAKDDMVDVWDAKYTRDMHTDRENKETQTDYENREVHVGHENKETQTDRENREAQTNRENMETDRENKETPSNSNGNGNSDSDNKTTYDIKFDHVTTEYKNITLYLQEIENSDFTNIEHIARYYYNIGDYENFAKYNGIAIMHNKCCKVELNHKLDESMDYGELNKFYQHLTYANYVRLNRLILLDVSLRRTSVVDNLELHEVDACYICNNVDYIARYICKNNCSQNICIHCFVKTDECLICGCN